MHSLQVRYGRFDSEDGLPSNKFGEFGEVLDEKEREFVTSLIWASYELTKEVDSKLYCCFSLPFIGKSKIKSKLSDSSIPYFYPDSGKVRRMIVVPCESIVELDKVVRAIWGEIRLAFVGSNDRMVLDEIKPVWIEAHESMPSDIVGMVDVIVTQFFHGLWLDVVTRKYSSSSKLFNDIRDSISVSDGVTYVPKYEW
jgi:hypothetical protein